MSAIPPLHLLLAFNPSNQLAVRRAGTKSGHAFLGSSIEMATTRLESAFAQHTPPAEYFTATLAPSPTLYRVYFVQVSTPPADPEIAFASLDALASAPDTLAPSLAALLPQLDPYLIEIPYLHLGENDFIYKFRPEKERNPLIYQIDDQARSLYQSKLCAAIKTLARTNERTATDPVALDFGPVQYLLPSHFGFCLGVKNAIERAYETLAENPDRRVFMLSELIHNPFVNEDLLARGLRYLQTDKGKPYSSDGRPASGAPGETLLWDTLTPDDIVIIPAFGATDDDKRRLVRKGVPVFQYDATCMLVEKVWKAARALGREGYTIIIHGKHEHEETKATFSNARRHAPALIIRNLDEAAQLSALINATDNAERTRLFAAFAGRHTPGFDPARDLQRIAVVNQTTLLMNETLAIIEHLRATYSTRYGNAEAAVRLGGGARRDTLCYATQVNQDALGRALAQPLEAAFVIGGKNSSNTYQLHRLCEQRLGRAAFFIQSEKNIHSRDQIEHYVFPAHSPGTSRQDHLEAHPLPPAQPGQPYRILLTGGASCPDGIIQQVINRINSFFPAAQLRPIEAILADLEKR